jgi:hypothetical protein
MRLFCSFFVCYLQAFLHSLQVRQANWVVLEVQLEENLQVIEVIFRDLFDSLVRENNQIIIFQEIVLNL